MRVETLVSGNAAAETIVETETPQHLTFEAGDGHDFHIRTQVTVENPADRVQTERLTVALAEGDTTRGRTLTAETRSVTLDPGEVRTLDFNTEAFRLAEQAYQLTVEPAGEAPIPIDVTATREYTRPVSYTWEITPQGDYELVSQTGRASLRIDGEDGSVSFPAGREVSTSPLRVGEGRQERFVESRSASDPVAITDSNDPTTLTFQAGDGIDLHHRTQVTVENPTTSEVTDDLTVELIERAMGEASATTLASTTQSTTVPAEATATVDGLTATVELGDGEYELQVSLAGTTLEVVETAAETHGGAYTWRQRSTGALELVDHAEAVLASYPLEAAAPVGYPTGIAPEATTYRTPRGDPTTDELAADEVMTFVSDGSGTGSLGDFVYAVNDAGTILTSVIAARANAT